MDAPPEEAVFGRWLRRRRKLLELTQKALARRVGCSAATVRKLEADERHPSRRLALSLAAALVVPEAEQAAFVRFARRGWADRPPSNPVPDMARPWATSPNSEGEAAARPPTVGHGDRSGREPGDEVETTVVARDRELSRLRVAFADALRGRGGMLFVLDDLQWIDGGSVEVLLQLAGVASHHRLLVLGAFRPAAIAVGPMRAPRMLGRVVHEIERANGEVVLDLERVDGRRFLDAWLDTEPNSFDEAFREALMRQTAGQPLFTVELLRAMQRRASGRGRGPLGRARRVRQSPFPRLPPGRGRIPALEAGVVPWSVETRLGAARAH